jgi:hypothetical protein
MSTPIPVTLADLTAVVTYGDVLSNELAIATALGFPTTAWQPVQVDRSTLAIMAQLGSNFSVVVNLLAQGAYASTAALMVDDTGQPITVWMDLRGQDQYNVTRLPATYAAIDSTGFSITNVSAQTYGPFPPGQLHFQQSAAPGQPTYTNSANVTLLPGANAVAIIADVVGSGSSAGPGTITTMVTALIGCTCTNSASLVGQDAETNAHYLARCQAKLGFLGNKGPSKVYEFVAESILDSTQPFYNASLSQPITRVTTVVGPSLVYVYIANASGAPSGGDVTIVDAAIQAWAVPSGTTAIVAAASPVVVPVTYVVYVPAATGQQSANVLTAISDALALYFETVPIGGLTDQSIGVLPMSAIIGVIWGAVPGITSVTVSAPAADVPLSATQVAILGTVTGSVVFTT